MKKKLQRIGAGLAFALMALAAWTWWGPGPLKQDTHVVIPEGSSLSSATNYLYYARAISGPRNKFYYLARLLGEGDPIQAGEFEIPARASAADVLDILQHGRPVVRLITIPEGMPSVLVQEKLAAIPELTGPVPEIAEGSVLPSSYDWRRGETRRMVAERMQAAMGTTLDKLWAGKKGDCPVVTKQEAVTLASIVEKETGKAEERRYLLGGLLLHLGVPQHRLPPFDVRRIGEGTRAASEVLVLGEHVSIASHEPCEPSGVIDAGVVERDLRVGQRYRVRDGVQGGEWELADPERIQRRKHHLDGAHEQARRRGQHRCTRRHGVGGRGSADS